MNEIRYFLKLMLLLTVVSTIQAQTIDLQLSNEILLRPNDEYQGLAHADETGYILHIYERSGRGLLDHPGRMLILEKYDNDYNQTFSYEYGDNNMVSIELFAVGNKLAWIVLEKISSYKYRYSLIPIDFDGKEGQKQKLFDVEINKASDIPFTYLRPSPDSSKLAFVALFDSNKKRRQTEVYTAFIDENANLAWDKFTSFRGNQKQYNFLDFQLNAGNELLALAKYYKDEKAKNEITNKRGQEVAGYSMYVYVISEAQKTPVKYNLDLEESFVHDASLEVFPSGEIYSIGLTAEQHKGNIGGVYVAKFDDAMNTVFVEKNDFNIHDLISLDKADADVNFRKKDNTGLDDEFELIDAYLLENGKLIITAEENFTRTQSANFDSGFGGFNRNNRSSVYLNSNDIVVFEVSPTGVMEEINLIPKKQTQLIYQGLNFFNASTEKTRESNLYLSHSTMVNDETLYFLYNEHRDNFSDNKRRRVAERMTRMEPALVVMNSDLSYQMSALLPDASETLISPTRSKQISDNRYFITLVPPDTQGNLNIRIGVLSF